MYWEIYEMNAGKDVLIGKTADNPEKSMIFTKNLRNLAYSIQN